MPISNIQFMRWKMHLWCYNKEMQNPWKNQENNDLIFFSERIIGIYFSTHKSSNKGIPYPELGTTGSLWIPHLCHCRFVFVSENYTSHKYREKFKTKFKLIFLFWERVLYSIPWSMWNVLCRWGYAELTDLSWLFLPLEGWN